MITCENCGKENPEAYDFCDSCCSPLILTAEFKPELDNEGNDFFNLPKEYVFGERYIIKNKIGRSRGLGITYIAHDIRNDEKVVLKLFRRKFISSSKIFDEMSTLFDNLKTFRHKNIANILDTGITSRKYYAVFEYLEGDDLKDVLWRRKKPFENKELLSIFIQLAEGLEFGHSHGIVHGELNPFNIIYSEKDQKIGITDYGITNLLTSKKKHLLKEDGTLGLSLFYTPPEVINGDLPTKGSDLYSLGAIMYELACNYLPFKSHSSYRLVTYIINEKPQEPIVRNPGIPLYIDEAIVRLLRKKPEERFPSATALLNYLRENSKKKIKSNLFWITAIILEAAILGYILYLIIK